MIYALINNGTVTEYPVYEGEIRLRYPNMSFSTTNFSPPEGYVPVEDVQQPEVDYLHNLSEGTPTNENGIWRKNWIVAPASQEEIEKRVNSHWKFVRQTRNQKLLASDWTQLLDSIVDKQAWAEYRQALRDITQQSDPFNIVWPVSPAENI